MGNSGSVHNLHIEGVSSELNSYYQQKRRASKKQLYPLGNEPSSLAGRQKTVNIDWTMSLPHTMATGLARPKPGFQPDLPKQFKVLPHLSERHKLRSTTNGAILHSGGTISGRKDLKGDDEQPVLDPHQSRTQYHVHPTPMNAVMQQRSRSFILESRRDSYGGSNQEELTEVQPPPVFRRAQTLLHFHQHGGSASDEKRANRSSYPSSSSRHVATMPDAAQVLLHARSEADIRAKSQNTSITASDDEPLRIKSGASKLNKYNKKRKAPPAPTSASVSLAQPTALGKLADPSSNSHLPTIGAATPTSAATQRLGSASRTGCNVDEGPSTPRTKTRLFRTNAKPHTMAQQQLQRRETPPTHQPINQQQLAFRRSAPLRGSTTSSNSGYKGKSAPLLPLRREKSSDAILLRAKGPCSIAENAKGVRPPPLASPMAPMEERKETFSRQLSSRIGKSASRIPQLKRTFYFGMNATRGDVATDPAARGAVVVRKQKQQQQQQQQQSLLQRQSYSRDSPNPAEEAGGEVPPAANSATRRTPPTQLKDIQQSLMHPDADMGAVATDIEPVIPSYNLDGLGDIYDIDKRSCEEDIDDNGLFVHVRPTLPRRQLDTPSFSPAAAWRLLVEDIPANQPPLRRQVPLAQRHHNAPAGKSAPAQTSSAGFDVADSGHLNAKHEQEPPIRLASTIEMRLSEQKNGVTIKANASAWTPQQDLDDDLEDDCHNNDDDDTAANGAKGLDNDFDVCEKRAMNEHDSLMFFGFQSKSKPTASSYTASAAMHVFSLSLPRDAHTQPHVKGTSNGKMRGFHSLQKQKCSGSSGKNDVVDDEGALAAVCELRGAANGSGADGANYRSDNWVLHHRTVKSGGSGGVGAETKPPTVSPSQRKWEALPSIEPSSLTYLTGGKHVIYLPGSCSATTTKNNNNHNNNNSAKLEPNSTRQSDTNDEVDVPLRIRGEALRKREGRIALQSLQDETPNPNNHHYRHLYRQKHGSSGRRATEELPAGDKPQRFSFQSTVRLLEKRRLAEKLSKDAEIREAHRKSELEAMKRVEEDFQRKRAIEKASIRHQLRLYFSAGDEHDHDNEPFNSLPLAMKKISCDYQPEHHRPEHTEQDDQLDANNNDIFRRADPDGAVSSPSPVFPDALEFPSAHFLRSTTPTKRFDSECGESDNEFDIANFKRTASLVEPYLQSIIK